MLTSRIDSRGRVLHHDGPYDGFYSVGRDDQCEYNGCRGYKASRSRHCSRHAR